MPQFVYVYNMGTGAFYSLPFSLRSGTKKSANSHSLLFQGKKRIGSTRQKKCEEADFARKKSVKTLLPPPLKERERLILQPPPPNPSFPYFTSFPLSAKFDTFLRRSQWGKERDSMFAEAEKKVFKLEENLVDGLSSGGNFSVLPLKKKNFFPQLNSEAELVTSTSKGKKNKSSQQTSLPDFLRKVSLSSGWTLPSK